MRTALAKLNLYLEVVGKRPDGYHELRTVFQALAWGDDVVVERTAAAGIACETVGADLPSDDRNLAVRAARAYLEAARLPGGASIRLEKRIPVGGGLGGGSSDAAAVLLELERLEHALGGARLDALARSLGSDVPFFLTAGLAQAFGRGDEVEGLPDLAPLDVVLVIPPFGTETAKVYSHVGEGVRHVPASLFDFAKVLREIRSGDPARLRAAHRNDLAVPALRAYPALREFTSRTERLLGRPPCMSGSGSTLFDLPDAGETADVLSRLGPLPGRRVVTTFTPARGTENPIR